jgi:uncharacterized protein YabE (DUF348 family)
VRRSPLRLAVLAGILAALASGLTAFATMNKTVHVDVDGHRLAVRTFAGNVAGVLRKAGIALGPHDAVAPDAAAPVHDGSRVIVRHGRLLSLDLDGQPRRVWVTALSVQEALDQLGLSDAGSWMSVSRGLAIPRQGLSLSVRLPQRVTVLVDGQRLNATTTAPDVTSLLAQLHVRLGPLDNVSTPLTTYPTSGLIVAIDRISRHLVSRNVAIPFGTKHVKSSALYVGDSRVSRPGRPGLRVEVFQVTW